MVSMVGRRALPLAAGLVLIASPASAAEGARCGERGPWIAVLLHERLSVDRERFLRLLRLELASRGFELCDEGGAEATPAVAAIDLTSHEDDVTLTVEVRDRVTAKRVAREVSVASYPPDARPLVLAVAADELLRASWAELALTSAPPPAQPVPAEITAALADDLPKPGALPAPAKVFLGVGFVGEHYGDGASLFGADVDGGVWVLPRLSLSLRVGARAGLAVSSEHGSVTPNVLAGGLGVGVAVTPPQHVVGLELLAHGSLARVSFSGNASAGARALPQGESTGILDVGASGWLQLGRFVRLTLSTAFVAPLRPVRGLDGTTTVVGVGGPGFSGGLGACATF
jgi:hypothetical protein